MAYPVKRVHLTAGRALFTIDNGRGEHFTYSVTRKDARQGGDIYFVSLRRNGESRPFQYVGVLELTEPYTLRLTSRSVFAKDSVEVRAFRFALRVIQDIQPLPSGYAIMGSDTCAACGRTITVRESIETGFGPECGSRLNRRAA